MEHDIVKNIKKIVNGFEAVIPEKISQEKRKGIWEEKNKFYSSGMYFSLEKRN